jgi:hypothetical protein
MCHPVTLLALAALGINDHLLKHVAPGLLTGKLSDVAGLVLFPLVLAAVVETVQAVTGRPRVARRTVVLAAAGATATAFIAVKSFPVATQTYNTILGGMQWLLGGGPLTGSPPISTSGVTDPTDLLALPALAVAYWVAVDGGRNRPAPRPGRVPAVSLAMLVVAGLVSMATSPPIRLASANYEERVTLSAASPAVTRHLNVQVTSRDTNLRDMALAARAYQVDSVEGSRRETPGVLVSLLPDKTSEALLGPARILRGTRLRLLEPCRVACAFGVTVIARIADTASLPDSQSIATDLFVELRAESYSEGTGPVDIDLALNNDPDRAFAGKPALLTARQTGSLHVGSDSARSEARFRVAIAADALRQPYGYPLIGEISVGVTRQVSIGDSWAHSTEFAFSSSSLPAGDLTYSHVDIFDGSGPDVVDLLPLCQPDVDCQIDVDLLSTYEPSQREGATPAPGSIDLDWFLELRLEAYDGRALPEGSITIEAVD